ncbi:MAG: hypothetical protein II381_07920, partial [Victivallales bacterium]|nr:hypothetical protein [Victivallales bacterium]
MIEEVPPGVSPAAWEVPPGVSPAAWEVPPGVPPAAWKAPPGIRKKEIFFQENKNKTTLKTKGTNNGTDENRLGEKKCFDGQACEYSWAVS